jgi:starch phosphorylase
MGDIKVKEKHDAHRQDLSDALKRSLFWHITFTLGSDRKTTTGLSYFRGLAYSIRDRLIERWIRTQRSYYDNQTKRVYYLSMEFMPGRFLMNNLVSLQMDQIARQTLEDLGHSIEDIESLEWEPGLGSGGLGRLASCYLDSLAMLKIGAYGYGIRYHYGIFYQAIRDGYQVEKADNWLRIGSPWDFERPHHLYPVHYYGRVQEWQDKTGKLRHNWVDTQVVMAMACDTLIPGYGNDHVINMRLWAAKSSRELNLDFFNVGDYTGAVEEKVKSENISMVLYPSDDEPSGKELRLRQQYFFVSATLQDIMRRYKKQHHSFESFPDKVAVHLNETHPALAIVELMRLLVDQEGVGWDEAWDICVKTFAYTNHTILSEALEKWSVDLIGRMLPRHLQIIYELNRRFLEEVARCYPADADRVRRMSLIEEEPVRQVRMAHLAIIGSHSVNGVSELHSGILTGDVFRDFHDMFPKRFKNITNGVTPRRWLLSINPSLSQLITERIGPEWITDLRRLKALIPLSNDPDFRSQWAKIKLQNKRRLADYIRQANKISVSAETLFDIQVKRIHEYKRQLLNILHVVTLFNRIKENPDEVVAPRTVIFAGKAAPGYRIAKLIIKLINSVGETINADPDVADKLKVIFLGNYCVSLAEKVIPAADLSEQISTAGTEASGTGNMKSTLNGALLIGTYDGANIEIMEEVGEENCFLFGLKVDRVRSLKIQGYDPKLYYTNNAEVKKVLDMIATGYFSPGEPRLFQDIVASLMHGGDPYMVIADYQAYVACQAAASRMYLNRDEWTRRSILCTANMGKFSSDRSVLEYASKVWNVGPVH